MSKKKLSDTQIIAIKASYDQYKLSNLTAQKSLEKVAEEWGVHWQTIRKVIVTKNDHLDPKLTKDIKDRQAIQIDEIVEKLLSHTNRDEVIKRLSGAQSTMAICQLIDKALKLRGEDITKIEIKEVGEKVAKRLEELKGMREALKKSMVVPENPGDN